MSNTPFYLNRIDFVIPVLFCNYRKLTDPCLGLIIDDAGCNKPYLVSFYSRETDFLFYRIMFDIREFAFCNFLVIDKQLVI